MASKQVVETTHEGCIHDVQADVNNRFLATAGSDGKIKIHEVKGDQETELHSIDAHVGGGVWQVAWAHPRAVGNVNTLASCGEDGKVHIWRDVGEGYRCVYTSPHVHEGGAVAVDWAPFEHGCHVASGGADGSVVVMTKPPKGEWEAAVFTAHHGGVTGISWAPFFSSGTLIQPSASLQALAGQRRFVTGGCDGTLRVWGLNPQTMKWEVSSTMAEHSKNGVVAIRDVQWAQNCGLPFDYIASCADDKVVLVWRQEMPDKDWKNKQVGGSDLTPCRVSWSLTGSVLAISYEDHTVSLWKEDRTSAGWKEMSRITQ
ncbi:Protein transport protein SEC13 [Diplonema papillatum]|nr:Protein transport protein SEC13 [Diplonema papillatum]